MSDEPTVTIGWQPKWWLRKDGTLVENPDYVEPEPVEAEPEGEPEEGTVRFSVVTGIREAFIGGEWVEMRPGDYIEYRTICDAPSVAGK